MRPVLLVFSVCVAIVSVLCTPRHVQTQPVVVTGTVTDSTTRAPIPRATVRTSNGFEGTATGPEGRYHLSIDRTTFTVVLQAVGYSAVRRTVEGDPGDTVRVDAALPPEVYQLGTVTVEAQSSRPSPSSYRLSAASLKNAPALGEADVVRTAAMLPGVTQPNDMKSAINVRGGASDQNQFLIDGIEVYNPNHLFGVLGPFNAQALEDVTVHTAQFPARYGGRLSSVISMQTRRPPDTTFVRANLSLVSASGIGARRFENTGVTVAARRTYADPVLAAAGAGLWYNFHDVNLKATHDLGRGVSVEALSFLSRDALSPRSGVSSDAPELDVTWGGRMGALRLRHRTGGYRHRLTGSVVQKYLNAAVQDDSSAFYDNRLRALRGTYHGTWTLDRTRLATGAELERQGAQYGWREGGDFPVEEVLYAEAPPAFQGEESKRTVAAGYVSAERHLGTKWSVQTGLRYSTSELTAQGQWAPRFRLSYDVTDRTTITATTGRYFQYVAKGAEGSEMTIEEPTFLLQDPQQAWTTTVGGNWRADPNVEVGAESYYRDLDRVRRLVATPDESFPAFRQASGTVYGIDLFARKKGGWLTGQLSYSYVRTRLTLGEDTYPPDWSTPHTLKGMVGVWLGDYWQFRLAGVWRSGLPFTPATGSFRAPVFTTHTLKERFIEGPRNSARLPAYTRLDVSLRRTYEGRWFDWTLYVQALNVLNRSNPLRVDTRELYTIQVIGADFTPGLQSSLPVIPSLGVEFQF